MVYYIVEASHLFRAGDKFQTQFFVLDVVNFIQHQFFHAGEAKTVVLHGSVKDEQAERYAAALERHDVKVIRMKPIDSMVKGKWYFRPTWYVHRMLGTEIPKGSAVVLVGFHNPRYLAFLQQYHVDFRLSLAAFSTPSKKHGIMNIPPEFRPLLEYTIELDEYIVEVKAEFKKNAKRNLPSH